MSISTSIVHNDKTSATHEEDWKQISKQMLFTDVLPSQVRHLESVLSANNEILHFHNHSRNWLQSMPVKAALWPGFNVVRPTVVVAVANFLAGKTLSSPWRALRRQCVPCPGEHGWLLGAGVPHLGLCMSYLLILLGGNNTWEEL